MTDRAAIRIECVLGDITEQDTDAIVNAANDRLLAGGGVCGAIFARAGAVQLQSACDRIGGCPTGQARLTPGFGIPVKGIIHAVGPVYQGGENGEAELLASAWRSPLDLADASGFRSIAFPSISTGIYGYPLAEAAGVAGSVFAGYLAERSIRPGALVTIRIVLRDLETQAVYDRAIESAVQGRGGG